MPSSPARLLAAGLCTFALSGTAAAQDIDTNVPGQFQTWGWVQESGAFRNGWGQTFTATENHLDSFSFWLGNGSNSDVGDDLLFRAYLAQWNGAGPGTSLWQSGILNGTTSLTPVEYSFDVGLFVDPGAVYFAYLVPEDSPASAAFVPFVVNYQVTNGWQNDTYDGGSLVWVAKNGSDPYVFEWQGYEPLYDAMFTADFSTVPTDVVPEPISMVLLGSGLFGVAGAARRRRREGESAVA